MSFLPPKKTDKSSLEEMGYKVTIIPFEEDTICEHTHVEDAFKEIVTLDGIPQTPDGSPSVKYFDINSKEIIGAIWTDAKGRPHREPGLPAAVYERTEATGAGINCHHKDDYYVKHGLFHNVNGKSAVATRALNDEGELFATYEEWCTDGVVDRFVIRDFPKGEVQTDTNDYPSAYAKELNGLQL